MKLTFYCDCGAVYGVGGPRPKPWQTRFLEQVRAEHLAEGHSETNAKGAAAARRKAEYESR